jgi:nicotinamide mononucleotide transporter
LFYYKTMEVVIAYLQANWIELAGSVLSIIYLYLSIKQRVSLWIFGFLCSLLYVVVFFQSKFYADMSLQFYYLGVSAFGWISWKAGKPENRKELPVKRTTPLSGAIILVIALVLYFLYYFILSEYTDSPLPKADAFTTALSIVATWMLARKMIEHWWLWIIVDSVSAGLYFYKALYPTAILFVIYTVMAIIGYRQWKKSLQM